MDISKLNVPLMYFKQKETRNGLIADDSSTSAFLPMLQFVLKNIDISEKTLDTSCDCGNKEKCKCNSEDEMSEVTEPKKSGLAACMECPMRESGQCELWNGKEDDFGLLIGTTSTTRSISLAHDVSLDEQSGIRPDLFPLTKVWLDYNGAYAYIDKKKIRKTMKY